MANTGGFNPLGFLGLQRQPTASEQLQARIEELRQKTEQIKAENAQLQLKLQGGTPAEQAQAVGDATTRREAASLNNQVTAANALQPAFDAKNNRAIVRDTAAVEARGKAEVGLTNAQGSNTRQLLAQFQDGERGVQRWITGDKPLLDALGDNHLRNHLLTQGGTTKELMELARQPQLLDFVGPLAGLALAFS